MATNFVHHVFFWMKEPHNAEKHTKLKEGLQKLVSIDVIKTKHIGIPADTNRPVIDNTYQFSLLVSFDSKAEHDIYQEHKIHKDFIAECSDIWEKVLIYDSVTV